ncbi:nitroreductase family protein [bacterium SCSIO 12696]|nr:nitroreductase family protein [bacterium SCSIO 12696]
MDALHALQNRVSTPRLSAPSPSSEALQNIKQAAMRAADHRMLRPWRFLVIEGEGLTRLGQLFVAAKTPEGETLSADQQALWACKAQRAPMIIVAIASCKDDEKVPEIEQIISAGCCVQNMLNAAFAQGVGAVWRTGDFAYHRAVRNGLGVDDHEKIVGYLYLGTPEGRQKAVPEVDTEQFFSNW